MNEKDESSKKQFLQTDLPFYELSPIKRVFQSCEETDIQHSLTN